MDILERNNVNIIGEGDKTLLFVHGYGCDQNMWRFITPNFTKNHKVILLDLVGCGNSNESAYDIKKYSSLKGHADDIIEICDKLQLREVTLIGHSISGNIGMLACIEREDIFSNLIMVCPSPKFLNEGDYKGGFTQSDIDELIETVEGNYLGWSKAIAPVIMGNPDKPELAVELEELFCNNNPEIAKHFARVTFLCDNRSDLKLLQQRTLIIQSSEDNLASLDVGKYVHKNIKNSELEILNTFGHCPHLSHPELTFQTIQKFIP